MVEILPEHFTAAVWSTVFITYRKVNQSHWKMPLFEDVQHALMEAGTFVFAGGKSSRLELVRHSSVVSVRFVMIDTNPPLQQHLQRMQQDFEHQVAEALRYIYKVSGNKHVLR